MNTFIPHKFGDKLLESQSEKVGSFFLLLEENTLKVDIAKRGKMLNPCYVCILRLFPSKHNKGYKKLPCILKENGGN